MKIMIKLAYSQLKINCSRTIWTLIAITLSTALTTAVCNFVVSGNDMLINLFGENYGFYGKNYIGLLAIPAAIFGIIIIAISITVISNIFRISTQERVTHFGIMKCTGATKKQITDTVMYESILLCIIGIPVGIILGLLLALGGISIVNYFLDNLNDLVHSMINEINLSINFVFSWQALLLSVILCFLTVLFSAWLPAHKAAKVPAIDCIRGAGNIKISRKQVHINPLVDSLFGFEGRLAAKNMKRNCRSFRAAMISLSVGVILLIALGGLGNQIYAIKDYVYMVFAADYTVISNYNSNYITDINKVTGKEETIFLQSINSEYGDRVTQKLEEFKDTNIFGIGTDRNTYNTILPKELISEQMLEVLEYKEKQDAELSAEIITLDQENYAKLCKKANVPLGSTILLNHYRYNDFGQEINLEPFSSAIKVVKLIKKSGNTTEIPIQGILKQEEIPEELFLPNTKPIRLIVPKAKVYSYLWYCAPSDINGFIEYSNKVLENMFPSNINSSYRIDRFHTNVYKIDDYIGVMNISICLVAVFMYSFVVLLMLIGLTNVISTLSSNVMMRSREFAVLKSVGMTPESLKRMLNYESILCSFKALFYGLPIGITATYFINLPVRSMFPIPYKIPWIAIFLCVLVVFLITWVTTRYAVYKLKNQNMIETIRAESGK